MEINKKVGLFFIIMSLLLIFCGNSKNKMTKLVSNQNDTIFNSEIGLIFSENDSSVIFFPKVGVDSVHHGTIILDSFYIFKSRVYLSKDSSLFYDNKIDYLMMQDKIKINDNFSYKLKDLCLIINNKYFSNRSFFCLSAINEQSYVEEKFSQKMVLNINTTYRYTDGNSMYMYYRIDEIIEPDSLYDFLTTSYILIEYENEFIHKRKNNLFQEYYKKNNSYPSFIFSGELKYAIDSCHYIGGGFYFITSEIELIE